MEEQIMQPGVEPVINSDAPDTPPLADPGAAPPVPQWNPKEWSYQYKGQSYYPESRDHLLKLAEKGHAFAQRLGEVNKGWEDKFRQYEQYKSLDETFRTTPEFAQKVQELWNQYQGKEEPANPQDQRQRLSEVEGYIQLMREREADRVLSEQQKTLMEKYKDYDWNAVDGDGLNLMKRVIKHALDNNIPTVESAFRDLMWESHLLKVESNGKKSAADAIQDAHKKGIVEGGRPAPSAPPRKLDLSKMDWGQVGKLALAEINKT